MLVADEIDHIGRVAGVEDRESFREPERGRVTAQRAVRDRVEGAADDPRAPAPVLRGPPASASSVSQRCVISRAARRVNVSAITRSAGTPLATSHATRAVNAVVLPVPGAGEDPQLIALEGRRGPLLVVQSIQRWEHTFDHSRRSPGSGAVRTIRSGRAPRWRGERSMRCGSWCWVPGSAASS